MATTQIIQPLEFHAFQMFAGIGGGSLGAAAARASWMRVNGLSYHVHSAGQKCRGNNGQIGAEI